MNRIARLITPFFLGVMLLIVTVYSFRHILIGPVINRLVVRQAAEQLDLDMTAGDISGNYLTTLEFHTVKAVDAAHDPPATVIEADRISLHYFPPAIIGGLDAFLATLRIRIAPARVLLDFTAEAPQQPEGETAATVLPSFLPQIVIEDASLQITTPQGSITGRGLTLSAVPNRSDRSKQEIKVHSDETILTFPGFAAIPFALTAQLHVDRETVTLDALLADDMPIASQATLQIVDLPQGKASFDATLQLFDGNQQVHGTIDGQQLDCTFKATNVDLAKNPPFLVSLAKTIDGTITGTGHFALDLDHPSALNGAIDLRLQDGSVYGHQVDQVTLQAQVEDDMVSVAALKFVSDTDILSLRDGRLPLPSLFKGDVQELLANGTGDFSVTLTGGGQWLPLLMPSVADLRDNAGLTMHLTGSLADGILNLQNADGNYSNNVVTFDNLSLPLADLLATDEPYPLLSRLKGKFSLQSEDIPALLSLAGLPLTTGLEQPASIIHRLQMAGSINDGTIVLSQGEFTAPGSAVHLRQGRISWPHDVFSFNKMELSSQFEFQIDDLAVLAHLFHLEPSTGTLGGMVNVHGTPETLMGSVSLDGNRLSYANIPIGTLNLQGEIDRGLFTSDTFSIDHGGNRISGAGSYNIRDNRINTLHLTAIIRQPMEIIRDLVPDSVAVQGPIQASLEVSGPLAAPHVVLDLEILAGNYKNIDIDKAILRLTGHDRLFSLEMMEITSGPFKASLSGTVTDNADNKSLEISLISLVVNLAEDTMQLQHPTVLDLNRAGSLRVTDLILTGDLGTIKADGFLQVSGASEFTLTLQEFTSDKMLEILFGNQLKIKGGNLVVQVRGTPQSPDIKIAGTIAELGRLQGTSQLTGTFDVHYTESGIEFKQFNWIAPDRKSTIEISGRLPFDLYSFRTLQQSALVLNIKLALPTLQSLTDLLPEEYAAEGSLNAELSLAGTILNPTGTLDITANDIDISAALPYFPPGPFTCRGKIQVASNVLTLTEAVLYSPTLNINGSGRWLSPPSLLEVFQDHEPLLTGSLDIQGKLTMTDISWAAADIEAIRRLNGVLTIEAAVSGPAATPTFNGTLQIVNGEVRSSYDYPTIRDFMLQASLESDRLEIHNLQGELGGAPFTVNGTIIDYLAANPDLELQIKGENLLLYRDEGMRFRSDVDVTVTGPLEHLAIDGQMRLTNGRVSKTFDLLGLLKQTGTPKTNMPMQPFSITEPPLNRAALKIRIFADKSVDISNNVTSGAIRPDILLGGSGEQPVITGNIYLDPTRVRLPTGTLYMEGGLIHFSEINPNLPQLDLSGVARVLGYDITVHISGTSGKPIITLSSSPPLPNDELLLLLLTGKPPESEAGFETLRKGSMNIAVYLGKDMLRKWFRSDTGKSDESVLERFELEIGRGMTRLGEETVEAQFRLAENVFRDNDVLFLTAEKDIYDAINTGIKIEFRFK